MTHQERMKRLNRALARYGLYFSSWFLNIFPYRVVRYLAHVFIEIGFNCTTRQRQIAQESLEIAFGKEKTSQEQNDIIRACFENLGRGMVELIYFMGHPKMILDHVVIEGKNHLDAALAANRGVIAVSAHFGNFPLMLLHLAQKGYKTNAIIRPARDQEVEQYFFKQRSSLGLNTIYSHPRRECVEKSLKVLRNNELLFIPLDQNFGSGGGVFVDFFGQKAATATGPVVFAMRTKALILPMFVVRENDDIHKIIIEPPLTLQAHPDDKEMILINTSKITAIIERYIRKYPQEWGWMHRRWKSRPSSVNEISPDPESLVREKMTL